MTLESHSHPSIERQLDRIEQRLEQADNRLDRHERILDRITVVLENLVIVVRDGFDTVNARLDRIEDAIRHPGQNGQQS